MQSTVKEDDWINRATNEELLKAITEIQSHTYEESLENECYKSFLSKLDIETEKVMPSLSRRASLVRKRSKSRSSAIDRFVTLTNEQKCLILQAQYEDLKNESEQTRISFEETLDLQKAISEELKAHQEEVLKNYNQFCKLVGKRTSSEGLQVVPAEKVLRFSDDYSKFLDTQSDKLRLKNSSIKSTLKKVEEQLRQKESGDVLGAVDFEQMKIDNTKCLAEIDEKNHNIQKMKITAARTLQILNGYKKKLNEALQEEKYIREEQKQRQEMQNRVESETILAKQELRLERTLNEKFEDQISSYRVPSVIDFVKLVSEERDLTRKQNIYTRKLKIAEVELYCQKKLWLKKQRGSLNDTI
ncbi:unnamed protein product [Schistosoma margrebowiei]|uniref:Cilia- and flagella-associated protein 263 n=1 Tax=Schistosoma margrebowiei TaxID=48269 RepID=A0AA85AA21_9TREM|nr:unnamed protein product [Schistosoma margrebowiei]